MRRRHRASATSFDLAATSRDVLPGAARVPPDDLEAAHRFASDPENVRFVTGWPNRLEDTRLFLEVWLEEQATEPRTGRTFAVTEPGASRLVRGLYRRVRTPPRLAS